VPKFECEKSGKIRFAKIRMRKIIELIYPSKINNDSTFLYFFPNAARKACFRAGF
jgi:hypothetical protein